MINFKLGSTIIEYRDFAKHHKRLPIMIGRTYKDGRYEDLIVKDEFRKDVEDNPDKVFDVTSQIYADGKLENVTDKMVWFENDDYIDENVSYYSIRSMNTKQTTHVRLKFQFEQARAYLDYHFNTSGSYAMPFDSLLSGSGFVEDIIEEAIDNVISNDGEPLHDIGFEKSEDGDYKVVVVDAECGRLIDIELPIHEITEGFIGIEVYKFEQTIVDDEKELEEMM